MPSPDRSLDDALLERSFQALREIARLARPHRALLPLHPEGGLLADLVPEVDALVELLADERNRRIVTGSYTGHRYHRRLGGEGRASA